MSEEEYELRIAEVGTDLGDGWEFFFTAFNEDFQKDMIWWRRLLPPGPEPLLQSRSTPNREEA